MSESMVIDLFREGVSTILMVSAPMMITALVVGLIIAIFQATTQIQEQTLAFVPKIISIFLVMLLLGPWILSTIVGYTENIFENLVLFLR
ncbi:MULTISPECIES: flagellar biosynthesis protein FliQ [unclassified Fusibacter]|uniref:flagellar biosynthesis protein FliQ n=1 Tax=unclassified Fusibacter TaxID=2624464 RepID=UPI001010137E|nr:MULTISPECIES: flagellar biosynthesis protein FliQ [unclassified Fusibacter]MCK8058773.1 flagellar biosynthesis protein FliQ [Fusibacter sp. A2]NPE21847.1 flagellar biosynthesis protein FliQ [Fusibacter sp. A1]RXV61419.1 flagellar biosynthetic protein FliQ [Fusibacter sp. A1]